MTGRLEVSEKTLELNLSAEILGLIRGISGLSRSYMIGMTQAQERLSGVDAGIASQGRVLGAIQFKAPHAPTNKVEHVFTLPGLQLACLQQLAPRLSGRVTYALPCLGRWSELLSASPDLLPSTLRLGVVGLTAGRHRVVVRPTTVTVQSDPVEVPRISLEHELREWAEGYASEGEAEGPSGLDVVAWLGELAELERARSDRLRRQRADNRARGQALRGLALVVVPKEGPTRNEAVAD